MRARFLIITGLAVATVLGAASAAYAIPPGPTKLGPTPTTAPPKGPKDIAPTPTSQPPKGPDDLAPAPTTQPPKPKAPGDLAPAPKGGISDPTDAGGSDAQVNGNGASTGSDTSAAGETVDATADASHAAAQAAHDSSKLPAFLIIFFALLVASLIGLVAMRLRGEDEDVERV